jgi:hypothetical protein
MCFISPSFRDRIEQVGDAQEMKSALEKEWKIVMFCSGMLQILIFALFHLLLLRFKKREKRISLYLV